MSLNLTNRYSLGGISVKRWRKPVALLGTVGLLSGMFLSGALSSTSYAATNLLTANQPLASDSDSYLGQEVIESAVANPKDPRTITGTVRIEGSREGGASTYNIGAYKKDTPVEADAGTTFTVPVVVTYPNNGGSESLNAKFVVAQKAPMWDKEGTVVPGGEITFENKGGPVPEGSHIGNLSNNGTASMGKDGTVRISAFPTAKPGEKITVDIVGRQNNVIHTITVTVVAKPDSDGNGVPDPKDDPANPQPGEDQCADTPAGAKVDENGCALAPSVGDVPTINGEKDKLINPITIPIENLGKATGLVCSIAGLPDGLMIKLNEDGNGCVVSGTPTEATDGPVTVTVFLHYKKPDGVKGPGIVTKDGIANIIVPVPGDSDGDGVPDPKDPANPQPGEDQCADTPAGAKVDKNGCALAPSVGDVREVKGEKGKEITPVVVPVENPGKATGLVCKATDLPDGLTVTYDKAKGGCVISGTPTEDTTQNQLFAVTVEFTKPDGDKSAGTPIVKHGKVNITLPALDVNPDPANPQPGEDQCADTPAGAKVDKNGCALAPSVGDVPEVKGEKGKEITPVVVPVENPGKATGLVCKATDLPDGLTVTYDKAKGGCVISGTPTEDTTQNQLFAVTVEFTKPDGDKSAGTPIVKHGKVNITLPALDVNPDTAKKDSDGDGVPDPKDPANPQPGEDQCADTPAGAKVDKNGCALAPSVEGDLPTINGQIDTPIKDIVIPIQNPGKATDLVCKAEGLATGLTIKYVEGKGCVISGTPTETKDGDYTITIESKRPDGDKGANTLIVKDSGKIKTTEGPAAPNWEDKTGHAGDEIAVPNIGGDVPGGTTIETEGPGKGMLDKDGSIKVTINDNAKPGDKIIVTVKDKDGNVLDTITVTVAETPVAPTIKEKLAKTGLNIAGLVAIGLGSLLAGAFAVRRRKNS
ncbi:hypothetical protein JTE88_08885 [Arcanobacterium phocisimile]|uniref:LPXTG-motif cell wall anchor domain-containing protein n=1 Tax=Arcanobacterium phocisimile TaxID=1302235 RepID=A0ABX7IGC6_9ACTO|nr:hypothetical protein [Arcanobacterium phocisimile]QRV02164.1 hypothetical protein JTE88_08885 [Arcanobacterium phocisimile]